MFVRVATYIVFQVLKVLLMKKIQDTATAPLSLFFISAFTLVDTIFYNFFEHSTFSEKDFSHKFSCFNRFTPKLPLPLNSLNLLSIIKIFC